VGLLLVPIGGLGVLLLGRVLAAAPAGRRPTSA
jgi:hypothetical protein